MVKYFLLRFIRVGGLFDLLGVCGRIVKLDVVVKVGDVLQHIAENCHATGVATGVIT